MFDEKKAELVLKFLNKAKFELGVQESALLVSSYQWLMEFFKEQQGIKNAKPIKEKKAIKDANN